jgi:hypothetical protein
MVLVTREKIQQFSLWLSSGRAVGSLFKGRKKLSHSIERQRSLEIRYRTTLKESFRRN